MITITKDKNKKIVTQGAYEEFYKHLGYEIVNEKKPLVKESKIETEIKKDSKKENTKKEDKSKLNNYSRK